MFTALLLQSNIMTAHWSLISCREKETRQTGEPTKGKCRPTESYSSVNAKWGGETNTTRPLGAVSCS